MAIKLKIIKELTPLELKKIPQKGMSSIGGLGCPAIFESNNDSYILIGKKLSANELGISNRVAPDEIAVEVPREIIDKKLY